MIKVTSRNLLSLSITLFLISLPHPGHAQYVPGQILVRLHPSASKPTATTFGHLANQYGILSMEPLYERPPRRAKPAEIGRFSHWYRIRITGNPEEAAQAFSNAPNIIYAQPNHLFRPQQAPNDPRFSSQQNLSAINWEALANALGPVQKQIIVAITDSGIDYTHEDLAPNIWTNTREANGQPGVDDDNNGYIDDIRGWDFTHAPDLPGKGDYLHPDNDPMDESSHGTHVAGIIGAEANNGLGIAGIAPDAQLMALRAGLSLQSGGTFLEEDDLAAAILYAVDNGAHIINMSWGGPERSFLITDALHFASENGLLLIAAAGNSGEVGIVSPAARNITIAVGATDRNDRLASFSTIGASLDLTAPGVNILSTQPGNAYTSRSGSSFAAPHISGLSALLLSRFPDLTPQQIRTRLVNATADLGFPGWDFTFGAGRIDAGALAALTDPPPVVQILSPDSGDASQKAFDIVAKASGVGLTTYRLSWGFGQIPQSWTVLQTGAPTDTITFRWPIDALQDTTLVLRLEADLISGRTLEDRVEVAVRKNLPVVSGLAFEPVLNGPRLTYEINWITDQPVKGSVVYQPFGALQEEILYSDFIHTVHRLILPERLPAGPLTFKTRSRNTGGLTTTSPLETFIYVPLQIPQNGFQERATLPDGFLVDRATDFNRDGRSEIVLMPYIEGSPFSPIEVHERQDTGAFQRVYESTIPFLPWSVGDIDADGRTDLVGSEFRRLFLFSGDNSNPFPSQQRLNHPFTWGGEIADIDGDGQNEILARSGGKKGIRILKRQPDGAISEIAFLPDSTTGPGDPGPRFVIADFDGDGLSEILIGDSDGDLWIVEYDGVGTYLHTWQNEGNDNTDVRWVGGGVDLDGDGQIEFVAARALSDGDDPLNGAWSLEIYSTTGPNTYALEWASRFSGVQTTGNGIAVGDLDADGNPDLAVTLLPDLYIIRSDAPNLYRPIWHANIDLTHRPLIADLDNNGLPEIVFNQEGAVRIFERTLPPQIVLSPQILRARPLDTRSAEIDWMQTPGAPTYRLYRGVNGAPLELLVDGLARTIFIDTTLVESQTYCYQVAAVLSDNTEIRSAIATVLPNRPPELGQVQPLNTTQLALTFSEPMGAESTRPENYSVLPDLGAPTSVIRDQEDHRIVLTFPNTFDPQTTYTLHLRNLADASGVLLPPHFNRLQFSLNPAGPNRIRQADFDNNGTVGFSDFLLFAGAFGSTSILFDLDGDQTVGFSDFLLFASVFGRQVEA